MQVLETVDIKLEWRDLNNLTYHKRPDEVRADGLHVSDVIRHIAIKYNQYTNEDREDEMPLRILLGLAFEESAARLYKGMIWQPGQIAIDDITGSLDGISSLEGYSVQARRCVDEFKYTGKSQRIKGAKTQPDGTVADKDLKDIRTEWTWMHQGMTYINLLRRVGERAYKDMNLARFHICWKFGAYTFPYTERYVRYLVQFTEAELRGNWALMQAHKNETIERLGLY